VGKFLMPVLKFFLISFFLLVCGALGGLFYFLSNVKIDFSMIEQKSVGMPSVVVDDEGEVWATFELEHHKDVQIAHVPQCVIDAFIAAEDHTFFTHRGLFFYGIIRSLVVNCSQGRIVQGASTITQQLAKLLFTNAERTFKRKIKEQFLAVLIEQQFSKEQILQTYLNNVYFGAGIYGIEAASQKFWAKSVQDLTLIEAATLAAIVKSPGHYCPLWYPLSAQRRRNIVLRSMAQLNFISSAELSVAQGEPLQLILQDKNDQIAPHAKEAIRAQLEPLLGREGLYRGGYRIATTLSSRLQRLAESSFRNHIKKLRLTLQPDVDGGLVSIDVATGHIKAMVGGVDFNQSQFNRALQARRQLGSIFKTVVYTAALEEGFTFADTAIDEPIDIPQPGGFWSPHNYSLKFEYAPRTLAWALHNSNNIIAVKTTLAIGPQKVCDVAKRFHMPKNLEPYPSLALGCIDVTVKEAAAIFNVFANNGVYVEPFLVKWVKDRWNKKIFKQVPHPEQIVAPMIVGQVTKVLTADMKRAFARSGSQWKGGEALGKTGTTNKSRTCWFAGSTPDLTTVIYIGCDDNRSLGNNIFASRTAYPIWQNLYQPLISRKKIFIYDPHLKLVTVDAFTGKILDDSNRHPHSFSIFLPPAAYY